MFDVKQFLAEYGFKLTVKGNEIYCPCPFHKEVKPSFSVNTTKNIYYCFGCGASGRIEELVQHITQVDAFTAWRMVNRLARPIEKLQPDLTLADKVVLDKTILRQYAFRHPYLKRRGISEETQRRYRIGFDKEHKAITIPWFDREDNLRNIKFRGVIGKQFWYYIDGEKIDKLVFGINVVAGVPLPRLYITEAEIDAMYLTQHGMPAVALGHSRATEAQLKEITRLNPGEIIIFTDNDAAGEKASNLLAIQLLGRLNIARAVFPGEMKDANDFTPEQLHQLQTVPISFTFDLGGDTDILLDTGTTGAN